MHSPAIISTTTTSARASGSRMLRIGARFQRREREEAGGSRRIRRLLQPSRGRTRRCSNSAPVLSSSNRSALTSIGGSPAFANPYRISQADKPLQPIRIPFAPATKGQNCGFLASSMPLDYQCGESELHRSLRHELQLQYPACSCPASMVLQVGYVGSLGRHLELVYEGNPISPAGARLRCRSDLRRRPVNPAYSLSEITPYMRLAMCSFCRDPGHRWCVQLQFTAGSTAETAFAWLMFQASYTWSHSIDDTSGYEGSGAAPGLPALPIR